MGLSTKQVSGDHGLDWGQSLLQSSGGGALELPAKPAPARRQPPQQPPEPVACPRCASTNTKFCYYNNYNKSQPRHFCKACKRHWTKGGTLRNVPVGGGRKNKRQKTSNAAAAATSTAATATTNPPPTTHMGNKSQQLTQSLSSRVADHHQDKMSEILYQAVIPSGNFNAKSFSGGNNGNFLGSISSLPLVQNQTLLPFAFSSLGSFESNPSPISSISASFRSPNGFDFIGGLGSMEESAAIIPTAIAGNVGCKQQWQVPVTSGVMEMMPVNNNYWNWDDIEPLVSTELNIPSWGIDTDHIKP